MNNSIELRISARQMAAAYLESIHEIKEAYRLLGVAQARISASFGDGYMFGVLPDPNSRNGDNGRAPDDLSACERDGWFVARRIKCQAWAALAIKMNMRQLLSSERSAKLDKDLQDPESLPDLTEESIFGMAESLTANLGTYLEEAVKEVYEYLRPPRSEYKTNTEYEIGERVIVRAFYSGRYDSRPHLDYQRRDHFRNLDNVFSLLDGKGPIKTYGGPIHDAVEGMKRFGDTATTEYFRLKVCKNGNMHVQFLRMDLVAKLNEIAGGKMLKHNTEARRQ